jgi:zinc transport system permease protein
MRTVGLLLVSALMVVPVATAQQVTRSFRSTFVTACGIGVAACLAGIITSYNANVAPGATIVVLALAGFVVAATVGTLLRRRQAVRAPLTDEEPEVDLPEPAPHVVSPAHQHAHNRECGHPKVEHDDHVDYVHDGHLHAAHGDHWDEH